MSFVLQKPFSPALQAAALWGAAGAAPTPPFTPIPVRDDDISIARERNYGGLNVEAHAVDVVGFYDPRTVSMRAPSLHDASQGITMLPGMKHGARPLTAEDQPEPLPRTKFSLGNDQPLLMDPIVLQPRVSLRGCADRCLNEMRAYSLATLIYSVNNAMKLREMLELAGVIIVTPDLAALVPTCVCAVFGDSDDLHDAVWDVALGYTDVAIVTLPNPIQNLMTVNTMYVQNVVSAARAMVNEGLMANYARVEGNRAYLQDIPMYMDPTPEGTGFLDRAMADPKATPQNRRALACLTGLPL
jgi:hypothetical protein